jgi:hypothetical protein
MKNFFTFSLLFTLFALTTRAQQLVEPAFSSADDSNETWYYIRFKRQAVNNLVWTTDFPTSVIVKQQSKIEAAGQDKHAQHWKLVGNKDAFYIENRLTNFRLDYSPDADPDRGIKGTNYIVDVEGLGANASALKLQYSTEGTVWGGAPWTGDLGWAINNPSANSVQGYINDRAADTAFHPYRDLCYYYYMDPGTLVEFIDASTQTIVVSVDSLAQEARIGYTGKATFSGIDNFNIEGDITATIEGADASAFGFAEGDNTVENGKGALTITFTPSEARIYNATLVLNGGTAPSKSIRLTGDGYEALNLPQFSDETTEHWYYIQFYRKAAANTVWSLSDTTRMIVQDTLRPGQLSDKQQWKIVGDWDGGYVFVNKDGYKEIQYNPTATDQPADRYLQVDSDYGDVFDFVRYRQADELTGDWQLFNRLVTTTNKYVNDSGGKYLCNWVPNSDGDRLTFIPADQPNIISQSAPLAFETRTGTDTVKSLSAIGLSLTADITVAISGDDAGAFQLETATLPAGGGTLRITFSPVETKAHTATLTLTSGTITKTISLTGNSDLGLPEFSTENTEVWYYIQFARQDRSQTTAGTNRVWTVVPTTDGERQGTKVMSKALVLDNYDQQWKITGNWETGYQIINRNGGEFSLETVDNQMCIVIKANFGDNFLFKGRSTTAGTTFGKWQLQIVDKFDGEYNYLNDFSGGDKENPLSLYSANDPGAYLNFIPASSLTDINAPSFDPNDKVVAVKYYTLLGQEVVRPATTGVYIVRSTHASGKIQAIKQLFIIK